MQIHNQREKESLTNPDIDKDRMQLNYDLLNDAPIDFNQAIQNEIDERYKGQKAIRKDAVKLCEFVVTSDKDFFDQLAPGKEKRFFEESLSFIQDRYGKDNILYGIVHKDEKTPHMHVGMVPITEDGKLAAKQFFGKRTELQQLQDKFHEHVVKKGFDLERGIASDAKHIETKRLKVLIANEQLKNLEIELKEKQEQKKELDLSIKDIEGRLSDLEKSLDHAKKVDKVEVKEKGGLIRSRTVELAQEDFESIKTLAKNSEGLKRKSEQFESYWLEEVQRNDRLQNENNVLKMENSQLKQENNLLKKTLERIKELYKEKAPELGIIIGYVKANILNKTKEKLLKRYFVDDAEVKGAQKFDIEKKLDLERQEQKKQTKLTQKKDRGSELEL